MASDEFSNLGSVISLLLVSTLNGGLILQGDWVYGYAIVVGAVSDEALLMAFQSFGILINHATEVIILSFLVVLLSLHL